MSAMNEIERFERAAELIALSSLLTVRCLFECARFATCEQTNNACLPICDQCRAELEARSERESWEHKPEFRELRQAKRARRLEVLLVREAST